jgi:hypothetical protein
MQEDGFMRRDDIRFAVAAREDGLRRVRSLTVRVGAVGVVASAAIAVALGHPAGAATHSTGGAGTATNNQTGQNGNSPSSGTSQGNSPAGNSQGSSQQGGSQQGGSQQSSAPQAPPQNLAPAAGSGQVVSGGS